MGELMKLMGGSKENPAELLKQKLCDRGFDAFIYESPMDKMKKQMEYANRRAVPWVVIVGSDELASGRATVKNMATGEQQAVAFDELINRIE